MIETKNPSGWQGSPTFFCEPAQRKGRVSIPKISFRESSKDSFPHERVSYSCKTNMLLSIRDISATAFGLAVLFSSQATAWELVPGKSIGSSCSSQESGHSACSTNNCDVVSSVPLQVYLALLTRRYTNGNRSNAIKVGMENILGTA